MCWHCYNNKIIIIIICNSNNNIYLFIYLFIHSLSFLTSNHNSTDYIIITNTIFLFVMPYIVQQGFYTLWRVAALKSYFFCPQSPQRNRNSLFNMIQSNTSMMWTAPNIYHTQNHLYDRKKRVLESPVLPCTQESTINHDRYLIWCSEIAISFKYW